MPPSVRGQVSYTHLLSTAAVPQTHSQSPQTHSRQPFVPATDGSGRYPDNVHFSHIMEHYIQLKAADIARNTIDLAAVVPLPVLVLATGTSSTSRRQSARTSCCEFQDYLA